MRRVLYFTGYRMVAQEWSGHRLVSSVYFEPDDQGLDLFNSYLGALRDEPVRLLVDLIEEEFRQIRVPLLRGSDRQAILKRSFAKRIETMSDGEFDAFKAAVMDAWAPFIEDGALFVPNTARLGIGWKPA